MSKTKNQSAEMLDLGEILELTVSVPFEYHPKGTEKVFTVAQEVFVERVTPELLDAINEASEKSEAEALRRIISETVQSWNIKLKGQMLGTDFDTLKKLPLTFLAASGKAIVGLWQGNAESATSSPGSSELMATKVE